MGRSYGRFEIAGRIQQLKRASRRDEERRERQQREGEERRQREADERAGIQTGIIDWVLKDVFVEFVAKELARPIASEEMEQVLEEFLETRSRDWWANVRASQQAFMLGMRECIAWVLNRLRRRDVGDLARPVLPEPAPPASGRGYFLDEPATPAPKPEPDIHPDDRGYVRILKRGDVMRFDEAAYMAFRSSLNRQQLGRTQSIVYVQVEDVMTDPDNPDVKILVLKKIGEGTI